MHSILIKKCDWKSITERKCDKNKLPSHLIRTCGKTAAPHITRLCTVEFLVK
jgi:hypothetical protein